MKYELLGRLNLALEEFRAVYPDAPLLTFQVFLTIATNQGVPGQQITWRTGASQSAISRHRQLLSTQTWNGKKPGLDLIEVIEDPTNYRQKIAFLTHRGRQLACRLIRVLDPLSEVTTEDFIKSRERKAEEE